MDDQFNAAGPWPEIIPFDEFTPPEFPLACFPEPLGEYGRALAAYTQTDPAMAGVLLLGLLGALFQHKYSVVSVNGNVEQTSIYAVAIAPPAERKSEVIRHVIRPLQAFEEDYNARHADDISHSRARRMLLERAVSTAQKDGDGAALTAAQTAIDRFRERKPLTLLADDTTREALVSLMAENGERMLIASDEGGIFMNMKGRYKQSGDDTEVYLKSHSGGRIRINRKSREAETLNSPALSMMVTVQPFVLENVIMEESNNARGLTARLVYIVCAERAGSRKAIDTSLTDELKERFESAITRCLSRTAAYLPAGEVPPARLMQLSDEAREMAAIYFNEMERRIENGPERAKAWNGKAFGLMMRIAGVFHAFECLESGNDPAGTPLPSITITAAYLVMESLAAHAEQVFTGSGKESGDAKYLLRRVKEMRREFGKQELWQKAKGRLQSAEVFDAALRELEEHGYIRKATIPTAGKPVVRIQVNPAGDG